MDPGGVATPQTVAVTPKYLLGNLETEGAPVGERPPHPIRRTFVAGGK